jgi:hypothetical protein
VRAGYFVENYLSISQLGIALDPQNDSKLDPKAVLMAAHDGHLPPEAPRDAVALIRAHCSAPLVLFSDSNHTYAGSGFDLVIPNLTPPEQWLHQIAALLEQSRLLRTRTKPPSSQSFSQPLGPRQEATFF